MEGRGLFFLLAYLFCLGFCFGILFLGSCLFSLAFFLLPLCVVYAEAGHLVLHGHHRVLQEHALAGGGHNLHELGVLRLAKALSLATVADWLGDAIRAAVDFGHNGGKKRSTLRAELLALGAMMLVAVYTKSFFDVCFFLRDGVLHLRLLFLW